MVFPGQNNHRMRGPGLEHSEHSVPDCQWFEEICGSVERSIAREFSSRLHGICPAAHSAADSRFRGKKPDVESGVAEGGVPV